MLTFAYNDLTLPLVVAFFSSLITTPIAIIFIKKFGLLDDPRIHKHPAIIHTKPIPRGGGIPMFLGVVIASFMFLPITQITIALFVASLLAVIVGVLDDKFDISRYIRLLTNFLCAAIIVTNGITIPFITNPLGGIIHLDTIYLDALIPWIGLHVSPSHILAVIWIVWVMNMLNWSKGVDGQMPGIVAISALIIGILSLQTASSDTHSTVTARLSFIIAGSSLGFLFFNYYPARIFPGYGATGIYLLLAAVSILSGAKLATAILVMGIPMIDGAFTIARRILTGRSPFWHDKKHLHHLLLKLGLTQRHIALFYWIVSAIVGLLSLALSSQGKAFAIVMLIVVVGGMILFLHLVVKNTDEKNSV